MAIDSTGLMIRTQNPYLQPYANTSVKEKKVIKASVFDTITVSIESSDNYCKNECDD